MAEPINLQQAWLCGRQVMSGDVARNELPSELCLNTLYRKLNNLEDAATDAEIAQEIDPANVKAPNGC